MPGAPDTVERKNEGKGVETGVVTEARARHWIVLVGVLVIALAAAGLSVYYLVRRSTAKKVAAFHDQWGALEGCTLGGSLAAGETPKARVRAIQLTALGIPRAKRARPGELPWPAKCASDASVVSDHAELAEIGGTDLKLATATLATSMREDANATLDIGNLVDQVWKNAAAAGLAANATNTEGTPPPAVPLFDRSVLHAPSGIVGEFSATSVKPDPAPTTNLRFLIDDSGLVGGALLCTAAGTPTTLGCSHLSADVARLTPGLTLVGTTDAEAQPWLFAGAKGERGIFRPSGALALTGQPALAASVVKDGAAWLLLTSAPPGPTAGARLAHLTLASEPTPPRDVLMPPELDPPADATLAWDWLIHKGGLRAPVPSHLFAQQLDGAGELGAPIDIGDAGLLESLDANDPEPRFAACRDGAGVAVRVHGEMADAITIHSGSGWSGLAPLATHGGRLTCHGDVAVVTRVGGGQVGGGQQGGGQVSGGQAGGGQVSGAADADGLQPVVEQSRCTAAGCTVSRLVLRDLLSGMDARPEQKGGFAAADVDGKLLLVWNAGPLGGLRLRFAPIESIASTTDQIIVDSREENGQSTITELALLSRAGAAILLVNTTTGARLFDVDGSGKVSVLHARLAGR